MSHLIMPHIVSWRKRALSIKHVQCRVESAVVSFLFSLLNYVCESLACLLPSPPSTTMLSSSHWLLLLLLFLLPRDKEGESAREASEKSLLRWDEASDRRQEPERERHKIDFVPFLR